jgi:pimeloyl-ACP methyl ester carboxylesterase
MNTVVDGLSINYEVYGDGPGNVVILEGWGTNTLVYESVANSIKDKYRVIVPDLPGFGTSDEPPEAWGIEEYSDFVLHFLFQLKIKETDFIGHSFGGRLIIYLSTHINDLKIGKIVLIDSAGIMPKRTAKQKTMIRLYKLKKAFLHLPFIYFFFPDMIDMWQHEQGSEDYRNASPIMKKCLVKAVNNDLTGNLKDIENDTLIIWGDQDQATPIGDAYIMRDNIRNSGLVVLEGCGHYSFLQNPAKFKRVLRAFLTGGEE